MFFKKIYLEDGVHDAAERSVVGEFCYFKDIKAPLVQIFQFLVRDNKHIYSCTNKETYIREKTEEPADLGELVLVVRVDTEAWHGGAGEAGAVGQFPHPTDVAHGFVFQGGGRDLHLVLLVCKMEETFIFAAKLTNVTYGNTVRSGLTHPRKCWRCIRTPGCQSDSSLTGGTALCSASS